MSSSCNNCADAKLGSSESSNLQDDASDNLDIFESYDRKAEQSIKVLLRNTMSELCNTGSHMPENKDIIGSAFTFARDAARRSRLPDFDMWRSKFQYLEVEGARINLPCDSQKSQAHDADNKAHTFCDEFIVQHGEMVDMELVANSEPKAEQVLKDYINDPGRCPNAQVAVLYDQLDMLTIHLFETIVAPALRSF